ncbi:MAG: hypothetical protein ACXW18_02430 [Pyrinomonadaceae bacterium]
MYLIRILLPLADNEKKRFPVEYFSAVRHTLTERFGGVTAFLRSPAVGLWKEDTDEISRDEVLMFEVLADQLDKDWWTKYRLELEKKFRQEELLVWASGVTKL